MDEDTKKVKDSIEKDIRAYKKLKDVGRSDELNTFLDLLLKTAAEKMVWSFIGDNVKTWDDFMKVRGEVVSYLYGVQEVRGADAMVKHLEEQLRNFYRSDNA